MADIDNILNTGLVDQTKPVAQPAEVKKNDDIGQQEFLQLLVAQLQSQDPLNPMDNEQFAVNLAQFSQLEQLISINGKLDNQETTQGDLNSLSSYLGQEVVLQTGNATISGGNGGTAWVNLPQDSEQVSLSLLNSRGNVVYQQELGAAAKGEQRISLEDIDVADGTYSISVGALLSNGEIQPLEAHAAGLVSGFVPGPDPTLIVNGAEVSPSDIYRVNAVY